MATGLLVKKLEEKKIIIKKLTSGEIKIHFNNKSIKDINIKHSNPVDLLLIKGVTPKEIHNSNLDWHIRQRNVALQD